MNWSIQRANQWSHDIGWLSGCNFLPSTAVNSTEMWQQETFDRQTIQAELTLAHDSGFNSCRVFLPFIVWEKERNAFLRIFRDFCDIVASCGISVMPVLFDDCAFAGKEPYPGKQDAPVPGVHNSGWTPSPGPSVADDPSKEPVLREYVTSVIGGFQSNRQIIAWDLYNEPGNNGRGSKSAPLVEKAFAWARAVDPPQPLTVGVWEFKEYDLPFAGLSDIISYHDYNPLPESAARIQLLQRHNRPLLCTEWLHRPAGNTFASHLPLYRRETAGAYCWGLVSGKTQTNLHWSTMSGQPDAFPNIWQQDVFYPDGTPYNENEIAILMKLSKTEPD